MNADRIVRAYYGDPNHPSTQRCRRRVHWMCEQAIGRRLLDIGCSGGIVSLILAREGFECTGVDIEEEALVFAREEAAKESALVRERLRFQTADATALPFEDQTFDTVIVGEVLEHLIHPQRVLMEARRVLAADGRLVVTVPLGLTHDHVDHKRVFYPSSLVRLTRPYFDTISVTVEDTYIRYTGTRRSREAAVTAPQDDDALLRQLEEHCLSVEVERGRARMFLRNLKSDLRAARLRAAAVQELEARLQDAEMVAEARQAALARAERAAERLDASLREREQQHLAALRELDAGYRKRLQDQEKKLQQLERLQQQEKQLQAELEKLRQQQKQLQAREQALQARERRTGHDQEQEAMADRLRQFAAAACPRGARILVVSKGDERLVTLRGQAGLHFPQDAHGTYAGFHPLDSAWAIAHLESLIRGGAEYLLLPAAAFWWLTHYAEFRDYLAAAATPVAYQPDLGLLLRLSREPRPGEQPLPDDTIMRAAAAFGAGQASRTAQRTPTDPGTAAATPPTTAVSGSPSGTASPGTTPLSTPPASGNGRPASGASTQATAKPAAPPASPAPSGAPAIHKPSMVSDSAVSEPTVRRAGSDPITVAAVLDRFTASCLRPEARLVTFRPDNWRETLEAHPPDVVFVESAWQGNDGAWKYRIATYPTNMGDELLDLVRWAKDRGIPTVFWNKEDPVHFDRFLARSAAFDYVFTTDARCIPKYRAHFGHDRVHALPFAAQPALHNPVQMEPRTGLVCFAGTYYGNRHDERRRDLAHILLPALEYGLDIYDRQAGVPSSDRDSYSFPEVYQPAIRGRLEYDEMVRAYKRYRVFLNVNSVKDSPTMFSRRVFELLACGTPVVSGYARGIVELLGDAVFIAESEEDTRRHLEALLNGNGEWARASLRGIRRVLGEHTYRRRLATVWETIGLRRAENHDPAISVLVPLQAGQDARQLAAAIRAQTLQPRDVVLVPANGAPEPSLEWWHAHLPGLSVRAASTAGDLWQEAIGSSGADAVAVMDPRDHYGPDYLRDHALALEYASQDFFGKQSFQRREGQSRVVCVTPGSEFHPVRSVPSATLVARRAAFTPEVLQAVRTARVFSRPSEDILSIDAFNYVQNAHVAYGSAAPMESPMLALVEA
ncbi:MAG TPA: methyltransferase domain-containing protein [Vicinamibacterales bacterium]